MGVNNNKIYEVNLTANSIIYFHLNIKAKSSGKKGINFNEHIKKWRRRKKRRMNPYLC